MRVIDRKARKGTTRRSSTRSPRNRVGVEARTCLRNVIHQTAKRLPLLSRVEVANIAERFRDWNQPLSSDGRAALEKATTHELFRDYPGQNEIVRDAVLVWLCSRGTDYPDFIDMVIDMERIVLFGTRRHRQNVLNCLNGNTKSLRLNREIVLRALMAGAGGAKGYGAQDIARFLRECCTPGSKSYLGEKPSAFALNRYSHIVICV